MQAGIWSPVTSIITGISLKKGQVHFRVDANKSSANGEDRKNNIAGKKFTSGLSVCFQVP